MGRRAKASRATSTRPTPTTSSASTPRRAPLSSTPPSPPPSAAFPAWSRATPLVRHDALMRVSAEINARRDELGELLAREEGKTLPEAIGEAARAAQIFDFFAGEALRIPGEKLRQRAARRRHRGDARGGRRRRHHLAVEFPDGDPGVEDRAGARLRQRGGVQAGRSRHRLGARARRDHRRAPACRPASSTSSWAAARRSARRCSTTRRSTPSPSPARSTSGARWPPPARRGCASSSSRWAARTR